MTEKCYKLYGTKILNLKTKEIGLLICLWKNKFADGDIDCLGFLPRSQSFAFMPNGIVCTKNGAIFQVGKFYHLEKY